MSCPNMGPSTGCSSSRTAPGQVCTTRCSPSGMDCSGVGSSPQAAGGQPASLWFSPRVAGGTLALMPGALLPPSLDHGVCRVVFLLLFLNLLFCSCRTAFFSLLNTFSQGLNQLAGSALASSGCIWGPAGTGSVQHRGSLWSLLTETTLLSPRYQHLTM